MPFVGLVSDPRWEPPEGNGEGDKERRNRTWKVPWRFLLWATLLRPDWPRGTTISRIGADVLGLAIAGILLRADAIVELAPHAEATTQMLGAVDAINRIGKVVLVIWMLAATWSVFQHVYRLVRTSPTTPA